MAWKLNDDQAILESELLCALLDVHLPRAGLEKLVFRGQQLETMKPLQVTAHPPVNKETIIESFVRGDHLVATYAQLPERTVRPQLSYRHLPAGALAGTGNRAGVELVVALQTSLLDSNPTFSLVTEVESKEILGLAVDGGWEPVDTAGEREIASEQFPGAFVFRLSHCDVSYVEMVLPADFRGATLFGGDSATFQYQLFSEFVLEKGVIRKGRVWAIWLPRDNDLATAAAIFTQLQSAAPPLTV